MNLKFKTGDRVFNKVTHKWVNIIEFDIETGLYIVRYDDGIQGRSLESEMVEGLVEDDITDIDEFQDDNEIIDIIDEYVHRLKGSECQIDLPEGYQFVDENGNVINATKIVLEKKKEYPKTYEECCRVVNANPYIRLIYDLSNGQKYSYDADNLRLYESIRKLRICRDAYWKIAGEEMGLGESWEPNWTSFEGFPAIYMYRYQITLSVAKDVHHCLVFPTEEMRDVFFNAFKDDIEKCKELL